MRLEFQESPERSWDILQFLKDVEKSFAGPPKNVI